MPKTRQKIDTVFKDPKFYDLPYSERVKVMDKIDSRFAKLPPGEKDKALNLLQNKYAPSVGAKGEEQPEKQSWFNVSAMVDTMRNVGLVYPAFETAANFATSAYGVPISGLVGLAALPFGLDAANRAVEATQKFLVYEPKTQRGGQLTQTASYPFEKLQGAARTAGGAVAESYGPTAGAAVDTAITASPALIGARAMRKGRPSGKKVQATVERGINKGVRPSVVKKEMYYQRQQYMKNARVAVDEIIRNKDNLKLIDRDGNVRTGLPRTLEEFSQAIEQTKRKIFAEYDALSGAAKGKISMDPVIAELEGVVGNRVLNAMSPETIRYAKMRMDALRGKRFSPIEAQEMVQLANQTNKAYYANPTPEMHGKVMVDSLIANNLRAGLDAAIESSTGVAYAPLKRKYGALRMLETDVTKRAIVDARKNIRGLIDFSDIFSGQQVIQGLLYKDPTMVAAGVGMKGISNFTKYINDPNRIVKSMFKKTEKLSKKLPANRTKAAIGVGAGAAGGRTEYRIYQ